MLLFRSLLWLIGLSHSIASVNLAFKRPTKQSSVFKNFTSDLAVDGHYDESSSKLSCSVTKTYSKQVWWQVELDQTSLISHIHFVFENRGWASGTVLPKEVVFVSNSAEITSGKRCYHGNGTNPGLINQVYCLVEGRYVTYYMHSSISNAILSLCEVEVFGCFVGFYGPDCKYECSQQCLNQNCEPNFGHCIGGCISGFNGDRCQLAIVTDSSKHSTDSSTKYLIVIIILVITVFILIAGLVILLCIRKREREYERNRITMKCKCKSTSLAGPSKSKGIRENNKDNEKTPPNIRHASVYTDPIVQDIDENILTSEEYAIPYEQVTTASEFTLQRQEYTVPVTQFTRNVPNKVISTNRTNESVSHCYMEVLPSARQNNAKESETKESTHEEIKKPYHTTSKPETLEKSGSSGTYALLQNQEHVYDTLNQDF